MTEFIYAYTKDNLKLMGVYWPAITSEDICIVCTPGMSGNIIENYFGVVLGKKCSQNNIGVIYGHNRGYNHINDIQTKEKSEDCSHKTIRLGATYERFEECIQDINL